MHYHSTKEIYRTTKGLRYQKVVNADRSIGIKRVSVTFQLGKDEAIAKANGAAIEAAWKQCKVANKVWTKEFLQPLVDKGIITQSKCWNVLRTTNPSAYQFVDAMDLMRKIKPEEIESVNTFSEWLLVQFTRKLSGEHFAHSFEKAMQALIVSDPIGSVRLWFEIKCKVDLMRKLNPQQTPQHFVGIHTFGTDQNGNISSCMIMDTKGKLLSDEESEDYWLAELSYSAVQTQ